MRGQIEHLLDMGRRPNITLQVATFAMGGHPAAGGPFSILRFPTPQLPDVVYLEQLSSALYFDKYEDTHRYAQTMDHLATQSPLRSVRPTSSGSSWSATPESTPVHFSSFTAPAAFRDTRWASGALLCVSTGSSQLSGFGHDSETIWARRTTRDSRAHGRTCPFSSTLHRDLLWSITVV